MPVLDYRPLNQAFILHATDFVLDSRNAAVQVVKIYRQLPILWKHCKISAVRPLPPIPQKAVEAVHLSSSHFHIGNRDVSVFNRRVGRVLLFFILKSRYSGRRQSRSRYDSHHNHPYFLTDFFHAVVPQILKSSG